MISTIKKGFNSVIILLIYIVVAQAETINSLKQLQNKWAEVNYQLQEGDQTAAFKQLMLDAELLTVQQPDNASLLIWSGIIKSSYAGVKGGVAALKYAKLSKKELEKSIELDAAAMDGSAYTSLGALYLNVPAWPIGFGSNKKAEILFLKALEINPTGIDSNYYYAQYLQGVGKIDVALSHYKKALQAPKRAGRPLADEGRRSDIKAAMMLMSKINTY